MASVFQCKNCGGRLIYKPDQNILECESCGSRFSIPKASERLSQAVRLDSYTCQSCGAELVASDGQVATFCPYCGNQSLVPSQNTAKIPKMIVPFRLTAADAKKAFKQAMDGISILPDSYKANAENIAFYGYYIPYYNYSVTVNASGKMKCEFDIDSYDEHDRKTYRTKYKVDGKYNIQNYPMEIVVDGSTYLDDTLSNSIAADYMSNYQNVRMQKFGAKLWRGNSNIVYNNVINPEKYNPAYLAGFMTDGSEVDPHVYDDMVNKEAVNGVKHMIGRKFNNFAAQNGSSMPYVEDDRDMNIQTNINGYQEVLIPIWFFTWHDKKNKRVSYVAMNGVDGSFYADYPIDSGKILKKVAIASVICTIISLIVMSFASMPLAATIQLASLLMGAIIYYLAAVVRKQAATELHLNDRGYQGELKYDPKDRDKIAKKLHAYEYQYDKKGNSTEVTLLMALSVVIALGLVFGAMGVFGNVGRNLPIIGLLGNLIILKQFMNLVYADKWLTEKSKAVGTSLFALILSMFGCTVLQVMIGNQTVCIIYALLYVITTIRLILKFCRFLNIASTRPIPHFFKKQEGAVKYNA